MTSHGVAADAPFRPRRGRAVPLVMATAALVVCVASALLLGQAREWSPGDRLALVALGAGIAAFLLRYATIRAVPDAQGLTVRNLMTTRRVRWEDVVGVRFPDGAPWVSLDLADDDELAVMAIQRADGATSRDEARRLAALVDRTRRSGAHAGE